MRLISVLLITILVQKGLSVDCYGRDYPECLQCAPDTGTIFKKCNICKGGYYSLTGNCIECFVSLKSCEICVQPVPNTLYPTECTKAREGYFIPEGSKIAEACPEGCKACTSLINCSTPKPGYFIPGGTTVAQKCKESCKICSTPLDCSTPFPGYYLVGNDPSPCKEGCDTCSNDTDCSKAKDGYYFEGETPTKCIDGCASCSTGTNCFNAQEGYYIEGGVVKPCQVGCGGCSSGSDCLYALKGYFLNGNTPEKCMEGCSECLDSENCSEAKDGYYLEPPDYNLKKCPTGCLKCESATSCTLSQNCSEGCELCSGSECLGVDQKSGYYLDTNIQKKCSEALSGCSLCSGINGEPCTSSACLKCDTCSSGYHTLTNTGCSKCKDGCQECEDEFTCTKALSGFFLEGGAVKPCVENCLVCSEGKGCSQCKEGYQAVGSEGKEDCLKD